MGELHHQRVVSAGAAVQGKSAAKCPEPQRRCVLGRMSLVQSRPWLRGLRATTYLKEWAASGGQSFGSPQQLPALMSVCSWRSL